MSFGEMGFLFGAAPGVALILRNMLRLRRHVAEAEALARDSGELLDFNYSASLKSEFIFRPRAFIHDNDGPGLRRGKERLLSVRRRAIKGHVVGGLVLGVGAILGSFLATGLWPGR